MLNRGKAKALTVCALLIVLAPRPVLGFLHVAQTGLLMGCNAQRLPARSQFVAHKHKGSLRPQGSVRVLGSDPVKMGAQVDGAAETYAALVSWLFGM